MIPEMMQKGFNVVQHFFKAIPLWWPIALVFVVGLLLILLFIWLFRRGWGIFGLTAFMVVFGCCIYSREGMTKPDGLAGLPRSMAIADNALGSFFMSRGGYDDFGGTTVRVSVVEARAPSAKETEGASDVAAQPPGDKGCKRASGPAEEEPAAKGTERGEDAEAKEDVLLRYYLFHALCYVYGIALLFTVFGRRLVNILCLVSRVYTPVKWWRSPVMVFWGVGPESLAAADAAARPKSFWCRIRGYPVFAIPETKPFSFRRDMTSGEEVLDERRIPWLYVDPETLRGAGAAFLLGARQHYFLGPDGQRNVSLANLLLRRLGKEETGFVWRFLRRVGRPLRPTVYIRIDADAEEDVLFQWAHRRAREGNAEIVLVHEPSLVASGLLRAHPMLDAPGVSVDSAACSVSGAFRVLLVGFGSQGRALLREMLQQSVLPGVASSFSATVVDANPDAFEPFRSFWEAVAPALDNSDPDDPTCPATLRFLTLDVRSAAFWKWLRESSFRDVPRGALPWNRVVLALPDDLENLRLAALLRNAYRTAGFFDGGNASSCEKGGPPPAIFFAGVRNAGNSAYSKTILEDGSGDRIAIYGNLTDLYRDLPSLLGRDDEAARFVNWHWDKENGTAAAFRAAPPCETNWNETTFFNKESTRSFVAGVRNLVALLGFRYDATKPAPADLPGRIRAALAVLEKDHPDAFERLAKTEHLRWNAFLLARGVIPWRPDAAELAGLKANSGARDTIKPNDQKERNRHAALVPYGKLPEVAALFGNCGIDKTDARFVRSIPEVAEFLVKRHV